jgi:hypothetical protein
LSISERLDFQSLDLAKLVIHMKEILALKAGENKEHFIEIIRNHFCVSLGKSRDAKLFQKPRSHLKILGVGGVI